MGIVAEMDGGGRHRTHRSNLFRALLVSASLVFTSALGLAAERNRIVFTRLAPTSSGLFLADADGKNEHALPPATSLDYNASFSADGKWILFTSERGGSADIYRVHPDGSRLERLTTGPSYDDQAALSPDGRTLAFVSTRGGGTANIWLLDLSRRQYTNLTNNSSGNFRPSWSPDGKWIAFSSDRDANPGRATPSWELMQSTAIYVLRPDGSGLRRMTELGGYRGSPQWSRDGRRIVCYQSTPRDVQDSLDTTKAASSQIVSFDVETGSMETHTTGSGLKVSPQYTEAGDIAYVVLHGDQQGLRFVSGRKGVSAALRYPSWSPDEKMMVYHKTLRKEPGLSPAFSLDPALELLSTTGEMLTYSPGGEQLAMARSNDRDLLVMNDDGTNVHMVLESRGQVVAFPAWSPDAKYIAFGIGAFFERPVEPGQLALVQPDGSGFRMLTEGKASSGFASWSPDGKRLVYRVMGNGQQGLRILNLDDGKSTTITNEYDTFPVWSPLGDLIAFCSFRGGDYDIYTMRPDGSEIRKLTDSHGNDGHPIWSPDGNWIVFSSSRKGFKDEKMLDEWGPQPYGDLFAMRADGSGVRQLTDDQWEDATPAWRPKARTRSVSTDRRISTNSQPMSLH
jgi:Tol biopolymer transport system component